MQENVDERRLGAQIRRLAVDSQERQAQLQQFRDAMAQEDFGAAARVLWDWIHHAEQALERGWDLPAECIADLIRNAGPAVVPLLQGRILGSPPGTIRDGLAYIASITGTARARAVLQALQTRDEGGVRAVEGPFPDEPESWERAEGVASRAWKEQRYPGRDAMERFLERAYSDLLNRPADVPILEILRCFQELADEVFFCEMAARASDSPGQRSRDPSAWVRRLRQDKPKVAPSLRRAVYDARWLRRQRLRFMTVLEDYWGRPLSARDFLALCQHASIDVTATELETLLKSGVLRDGAPFEEVVPFRPAQLLGLAHALAMVRRAQAGGSDGLASIEQAREALRDAYEQGMQAWELVSPGASPFTWLRVSEDWVKGQGSRDSLARAGDEILAHVANVLLYAHGIRPPRRRGRAKGAEYGSFPYFVLRDLCLLDYRARGEAVAKNWLLLQVAAAQEQGSEYVADFLCLSRVFFERYIAAGADDRGKLARGTLDNLGGERTIVRAARDIHGTIDVYRENGKLGWRPLPLESARQDGRVIGELLLSETGIHDSSEDERSELDQILTAWLPPGAGELAPLNTPPGVRPGSNLGTWLAFSQRALLTLRRLTAGQASEESGSGRLWPEVVSRFVKALGAGLVKPHHSAIDAWLSTRSAYYASLTATDRHVVVCRLWPLFETLFRLQQAGRGRELDEIVTLLCDRFCDVRVYPNGGEPVGFWPHYFHIYPDDDSENWMDGVGVNGPYLDASFEGVGWSLVNCLWPSSPKSVWDMAKRVPPGRGYTTVYQPQRRRWYIFARCLTVPWLSWIVEAFVKKDE